MPESPVSRFTYRAFISYSHRDGTWGDWLHKALETYRVPSRLVGSETAHGKVPRRLNPVFRDREELASATDLGRTVNAALGKSENLIVICSPASAASRWVNEEVLAYKRLGRGDRIFCLIVDGEPNATDLPGREAEECFCPALRFVAGGDGQLTDERTEPIAADARPGKDGKPNARLKLIAGMLGVGFDALKQREQQRRIRRMTAIATVAVCVMAITSVLAMYALISRHQAVIARHEAIIAQQAAQRRQKQAEGLVNFMLGDLNDKLAQVTRLDIMQTVDDKAMAYFQSLPDTDVTPEALAQRAKALEKIGAVRMDQGHLPAALQAFDASIRISSRLADENPADVERQVAYSRTLAFKGMVHWNQGNLDAAHRDFETARQALQNAAPGTSGEPSVLIQLAYLSNDIGHVLEAQGQPAAAESEYRQTLALARKLVMLEPDSIEYAQNLGSAHNNLGKMALLRGDLASAIAEYHADDAIETTLSARDPKDNDQRENMMRVRAILGRTLALAGQVATGMRDLQQAVDIAQQLRQVDSTQTGFQDDLALDSIILARMQRLNGDVPAARTSTARSIAILGVLVKKDPTNHGWQGDYAAALTGQAAESLAASQPSAAHDQVQHALQILEPMLARHPDDRGTLLATMTAKLLLADASTDPQTARTVREQAVRTLQAVITSRVDPRLLALQVEALLALGRQAEAQPLIKHLWTDGYRDPALLAVLHREHIDYPVNTAFAQRLAGIMERSMADAAPPPTSGVNNTSRPSTHR
ncbi:MAG: TIR domain-containing protein [Xanthomonadaceae bacterium]|nr:TIR domain-containing protein [Xanthomonadaceae bacterium]